jgi:hypothetical protein
MDVHQVTAGTPGGAAEQPPVPGPAGPEPAQPEAAEPEPVPDDPFAAAAGLNRLAKIVLAVVPALTVALTAVGGATGGLARLFRDQTGAARGSIALIFVSFALAALAARTGAGTGVLGSPTRRRLRLRAALLLISTAAFVGGVAWAFDAQISVMGRGQAPLVTGAVTPVASGATLDARVTATGVRSSDRIVVYAFESSDEQGDVNSRKVPLYYSKSGPDADGRVDLRVLADVPGPNLQQFPYVFVTAVLGEEQRDCDGLLIQGAGPPAPNETACLSLQRPGAVVAAAAPSAGTPAAPSVSAARTVDVPGTVSWTPSGVAVTQGQRLAVQATGQVSYVNGGPLVGPDGAPDLHPGVCVLPGPTHHAGLIGRISGATTGPPFLIGSSFYAVAGQSGALDLGVNDIGVDDNAGSFRAAVQAG